MKQNTRRWLNTASVMMCTALLFSSCEDDMTELAVVEDADGTSARAIYSSRTVNWDSRGDGTYTSSAAATDFGNVSGWNDSRASISGGTCRIKLLANALSNESGIIANVDIADGQEYEVTFSVKYHSAFEWSRGGKVGFGFKIGEGNTGCDRADDGNGGSLRIMWYNDGSRTFFRPYVYYKDMPSTCGNNFGKSYPSSGSISRSTWYTVTLYAKSNTGTSTNGYVRVTINGTTVLGQSIRWTTNDAQRLIKTLAFHTFRGGSDTYWQASTDGYIYYDNLSWRKIS